MVPHMAKPSYAGRLGQSMVVRIDKRRVGNREIFIVTNRHGVRTASVRKSTQYNQSDGECACLVAIGGTTSIMSTYMCTVI